MTVRIRVPRADATRIPGRTSRQGSVSRKTPSLFAPPPEGQDILPSSTAFSALYQAPQGGVHGRLSPFMDFVEMQGRTKVTTILFYPGNIEGMTGLHCMGLDYGSALGNDRVKFSR